MHLPRIVHRLRWFIVHSSQFIVNRSKNTENHEPKTINCKPFGFTLIELLVVIAIISILAAISAASYTQAQKKGRDSKRKADVRAVQQALELYFQTNGQYPANSGTQIKCNVSADTTVISWGTNFICNSITYMNPLPKDPDSPAKTYSYSSSALNKYQLNTVIENTNDPDYCDAADCISAKGWTCQPAAGYFYCVSQL